MARYSEETLRSRLRILADLHTDSECWEWVWAKNQGYGRMGCHWAHRLVYQHFVALVPAGMFVLHECDNPTCVNPKHLKLGTNAENMRDMMLRGRQNCYRGPKIRASTDVEQSVRHLYFAERRSQVELARHFGLSRETVNCICNRRRAYAIT